MRKSIINPPLILDFFQQTRKTCLGVFYWKYAWLARCVYIVTNLTNSEGIKEVNWVNRGSSNVTNSKNKSVLKLRAMHKVIGNRSSLIV